MESQGQARRGKRLFGLPKPVVVGIPILAFVVAAVFSVTPLTAGAGGGSGPAAFDAASYAKGAYSKTVLPYITANAVDLSTLLADLSTDAAAAEKKYGHDAGAGSQFSFPITTTAVAGKVENGLLPLTLATPPAKFTVFMQIGPAINGTALRDVTGKIAFGQFQNQIDYQDAALALNAEAKSLVLDKLDPTTLDGKKLTIVGAFQASVNPGFVAIVPTKVTVAP